MYANRWEGIMLKIIVIGSPGAGKSVFSQKLSKITHLSKNARNEIERMRYSIFIGFSN